MIPFVGGSYNIALKKADRQRSVNMHLVNLEVPGGKSQQVMDSIPGYRVFDSPGGSIRGAFTAGNRTFFVAGKTLCEYIGSASVSRGTLLTSAGVVNMDYGISQLVMVDGDNGYVLDLGSNAFTQITAAGFYGSKTVTFLDNYFLFVRPDSGQFYISALNDATSEDPLDFATAESQPDNLVGSMAVQRRLLLFGALSIEIWFDSGAALFPFEREGTTIEIGCVSPYSLCKIDNTAFWIGQDKNGTGIVYRLSGYQADRISQEAVEEALQRSTDLSGASAYAYQQNGLLFYAIQAPGLTSTWVYEVKSQQWHERADTAEDGSFVQDRGMCHTFGQGKNLLGGSDGVIYQLDKGYYMKGTSPLVRERTSPHNATPSLENEFFSRLVLDCTTGESLDNTDTFVELSWYDWKPGAHWSDPIPRSIGKIGERFARLVYTKLGFSKDRIWKVRYSGNAPFAILNVTVQ